ncbi:MAG: hypothetical protein HYY60_01900 [Parcubacteria group bacterium]|nr:hypothetical protein [Parcubacteria group bacterium]
MDAEELIQHPIQHPSIQQEFNRIRIIGGEIEIKGNTITLSSEINVPYGVLASFAERIKKIDSSHLLEVTVKDNRAATIYRYQSPDSN